VGVLILEMRLVRLLFSRASLVPEETSRRSDPAKRLSQRPLANMRAHGMEQRGPAFRTEFSGGWTAGALILREIPARQWPTATRAVSSSRAHSWQRKS